MQRRNRVQFYSNHLDLVKQIPTRRIKLINLSIKNNRNLEYYKSVLFDDSSSSVTSAKYKLRLVKLESREIYFYLNLNS